MWRRARALLGQWSLAAGLQPGGERDPTLRRRKTQLAICRHVAGANASANLYSLIETAKANYIEPYGYLVAPFKNLPLAQTAHDYEALLPWNIALGAP